MTVENRQFVTLDEIIAIKYQCKECGASIIIPRAKWGTPQRYCPGECTGIPNLPKNWVPQGSTEDRALTLIEQSIQALIGSDGIGCTIGFEVKKESEE